MCCRASKRKTHFSDLAFHIFRCTECKKISVISYTYYLLLSRSEDKLPEDKILSQSVYYTRMCIGAEYWINMAQIVLQQQKKPVQKTKKQK